MQPTQLHPIKDGDQGSRVGLWTLECQFQIEEKPIAPTESESDAFTSLTPFYQTLRDRYRASFRFFDFPFMPD
ncbi:MAG: hypothetical protein HWQ38_20190 [Nostoc sp. NMS7]|uniref:hypothetical protein n=1 Tax=Nostoc sp. NMS7 TaxID=2815391 RepID=UPI0025F5713F|nr:hypothetical protein [Nostoc sp. NMS7]MBN3948648.1 hypothetical protein [Nostoc sp. NMS7]